MNSTINDSVPNSIYCCQDILKLPNVKFEMSVEANILSSGSIKKSNICDDVFCPSVQKNSSIHLESIPSARNIENKEYVNLQKSAYRSCAQNGNDLVVQGLAELNEILENLTTLCKSPNCYNEYMGYSIKNNTIVPTKKTNLIPETNRYNNDNAQGNNECSCTVEEANKSKYLHEIYNKNSKHISTKSNCKKEMCPFTSEYFSNRTTVSFSTYKNVKEPTIPCNSEECPYTNKPHLAKNDDENNGSESETCGGLTCPFAKKISYQTTANYMNHKSRIELDAGVLDFNNTEPCRGVTCPFELKNKDAKKTRNENYSLLDLGDPVGLCGRVSCPYAFVKTNDNIIEDKSEFKRETPICPYATPANNLQELNQYGACGISCMAATNKTPYFGNYDDYGFSQEASRPYSGSICPYALLNSGKPNELDIDRNLYSRLYGAEITDLIDLNRKVKQNCEVISIENSMDTCDDNSCFAKQKILKSSSDTDCFDFNNTEPCRGVTCPFELKNNQHDCTCDSPDVEPCGSPDCKITKHDKECNHQTCPVLKILSFCKGCGGVIISDENNREKEYSRQVMIGRESSNFTLKDLAISNKKLLETYKNNNKTAEIEIVKDENITEQLKINDKKQDYDFLDNKQVKTKNVKKKRRKVMYSYPGVELGHKDCTASGKHVPRNMGWLWTIKPQGNVKLWRGYKPGAVPKAVHKMMVQHRRDLGIIDPMDYAIRKKRSKSSTRLKADEPKHAVILKKVNGIYMITVNPVKNPKTTQANESPFMECTPMQFKIEKEPSAKEKTTSICPCDKASITSMTNQTQSVSNSELEFHFSPPAAIPDLKPKKKKPMASAETQYNTADIATVVPAQGKKKTDGKNKKGAKGKKKGKK